MIGGAPLLSISGLTRTFGSTVAVDSVDLEVAEGARHAVIGPNGAGKTTLLGLISGDVRPSSGRMVYAGRDAAHLSRRKRSLLGIARTFQQPTVLATLSVLDNVGVAAWRHSAHDGLWRRGPYRRLTAECVTHLEAVGLADSADRVAGSLGHGERRMLDIAMALAAKPRLLLLDEPAAGLTEDGVGRLVAAIQALPEELTMIVVEHDFAFVTAVAGSVTVLHDGRKLAEGTPAEIAADEAVRVAYLGSATAAA